MPSIPLRLLPFGTLIAPLKPASFEMARLAHWRVADAHATWA